MSQHSTAQHEEQDENLSQNVDDDKEMSSDEDDDYSDDESDFYEENEEASIPGLEDSPAEESVEDSPAEAGEESNRIVVFNGSNKRVLEVTDVALLEDYSRQGAISVKQPMEYPFGFRQNQVHFDLSEAEWSAAKDGALKVLVVDDSVVHCKTATRQLSGQDKDQNTMWLVKSVVNGEEALKICMEELFVPDVIIIDQYMESAGGLLKGHEVVRKLRQHLRFKKIAIIGCSAGTHDAYTDLMDAGCDAVWAKPFPKKEEARHQMKNWVAVRKCISIDTVTVEAEDMRPQYEYHPSADSHDTDPDVHSPRRPVFRQQGFSADTQVDNLDRMTQQLRIDDKTNIL